MRRAGPLFTKGRLSSRQLEAWRIGRDFAVTFAACLAFFMILNSGPGRAIPLPAIGLVVEPAAQPDRYAQAAGAVLGEPATRMSDAARYSTRRPRAVEVTLLTLLFAAILTGLMATLRHLRHGYASQNRRVWRSR